MHAIVTVIGQDRVGIIAGICVALAAINVNVLDISQTILGGMFTMVMLVDIKEASVPFAEISYVLDWEGERLGMNDPHPAGGHLQRHAPHLGGSICSVSGKYSKRSI